MVNLTVDLISKSRNHFKKKGGLSFKEYLRKLTHLYFSSKNIDTIGDLSACKNLTVLYLYDNCITYIHNLGFASNLTHLYMQRNSITHIDNLHNLRRLAKLYLGGNRISVVEGLEQLHELKELHLENQKLSPEKLLFDPMTLLSLGETLCVLIIDNNNIEEIQDLVVLKLLQHFSAAQNKLHNIEELEETFCHWHRLRVMDLSGNPVCRMPKYRDRLITECKSLETLDGKDINGLTRQFLVKWKASKLARRAKESKLMVNEPFIPYSADNLVGELQSPSHMYSQSQIQSDLDLENLENVVGDVPNKYMEEKAADLSSEASAHIPAS